MASTPVVIPASLQMHAAGSRGSSNSSSAGSSPGRQRSHSVSTSFFGRKSPVQGSKIGITTGLAPPSPATQKKLLRIRKMSDMPRTASNFSTIPLQVSEISTDWAKLIINQLRLKRQEPPLKVDARVTSCKLEDCKKSNGDMSTTCRMEVEVLADGKHLEYYFIAKLLPRDDPCRLYCFEANVFEKEISIYFELLPALRQTCEDHKGLARLFTHSIPNCVYGSNNIDGAGVLVFECALQMGFIHPVDPEGLSLKQVLSVINLMAKFHAIGSAKVNKCHKQMKLRHPYLLSNVYSSPTMIEGAQNMFSTYLQFLRSVPGQHHLVETFERHCAGEEGAKLMYSCLRRQVENPFNTIVHGELWEKNMLFRQAGDGEDNLECVVLDWKNAKLASATKDLAFLLLSSTRNSLRTNHLDEILRQYYSTFCDTLKQLDPELCEKVTFDEFVDDYKMSTKGAFMQAVCCLVQEMQFFEHQLTEDRDNLQEIADTLHVYEDRALNMMNDATLTETHFC